MFTRTRDVRRGERSDAVCHSLEAHSIKCDPIVCQVSVCINDRKANVYKSRRHRPPEQSRVINAQPWPFQSAFPLTPAFHINHK